MNPKSKTMALASVLFAAGLSCQAADTTVVPEDGVTAAKTEKIDAKSALKDSTLLMGTSVENNESVQLGDIRKFLIDESGRITFVVLGTGGVIGLGERLVPVPWETFSFTSGTKEGAEKGMVKIDANADKLNNAPDYTKENADQYASFKGAEAVYAYWGVAQPVNAAKNRHRKAAQTPREETGESVGRTSEKLENE